MADSAAAPRSWMLWAVAVAGIGVVTGVLVLALASEPLGTARTPGVPRRLDRRAVRAERAGGLVAAAGEPARAADAAASASRWR